MAFFLAFTPEGRQVFSVQEGKCSALLAGAPVITHNTSLVSSFTKDTAVVVSVNQLDASSIISKSAMKRMVVGDGDDALRGDLGWLDEEEAPMEPMVAMVMVFKRGSLKSHRFLLGSKTKEITIPTGIIQGLGKEFAVVDKPITISMSCTSLSLPPGRKASPWKRMDEMFKDSMASNDHLDWVKLNLYTRWRILELPPQNKEDSSVFSLNLEGLPLESSLELQTPEKLAKYQSSSNAAIPLASFPLQWQGENSKKGLFTTPSLVLVDNELDSMPTDGMVRLAMATIRDTLRAGKLTNNQAEGGASVQSPEVFRIWKWSPRALYMPVSTSYSVVEKDPSEQPFAELNEDELTHIQKQADDSLRRQHFGVGGGSNQEYSEPPLLGPKTTGQITMGSPWNSQEGSGNEYQTPHNPGQLPAGGGEKGLTSVPGGWMFVCEFEKCPSKWSTQVLPLEQVAALVKLYEMHVGQVHGKKEGEVEMDKEHEIYKEATRLETIPAHTDNRVDVLSPVRFKPLPLRHQYIAKQMPIQQTPVWERLDLSHLGLNLADSSIIGKCHNRGYTGAQLRHFSGINLGLDPKDKDVVLKPMSAGGLKQTRNLRNINNMDEAVLALMNCDIIMRQLHPCDYGTTAIVRFLMDKIHHQNTKLTSVVAVCNFFQAAFKGNAERVFGPDNPRTYQEIVNFFNSMDWNGVGAGSSYQGFNNNLSNSPNKRGLKRLGGADVGKGVEKRGKAQTVCYAFNSVGGCKRTAQGEGCVDKIGKQHMHVCNHTNPGGNMCASKDHGKEGH